jgi:nicotinamidase-related amidase
VQRNIARFGGDPHDVTLFGESAGGLSTLSQVASPQARGLFQKAMVESGSYDLTQAPLSAAEAAGEAFATKAGCASQTAACLRRLPVPAILADEDAAGYTPNLNSEVLPESLGTAFAAGDFNRVPVVNGTNHDEWSVRVLGRPAGGLVARAAHELSCSEVTAHPARWKRGRLMSIDPTTTAVVLIEYQNDFTSDGGVLHPAVTEVMDQTGMLDNTKRVVEKARAAGATVMHAPITFAAGYNEISAHPYGILKGVVDGNAFVKGTWGAAIVDDLAPESGDILIEGKRGLDTFASTNLDFILRSKGITTIALGGFLTNCCVESTMRTGYENGYQVITLSDCVAATSAEGHDNALRYDYPMFSVPMTSAEFIEAIG